MPFFSYSSQFENVFDEFIHYAKERNNKRKQVFEVKKDPLEVNTNDDDEKVDDKNLVAPCALISLDNRQILPKNDAQ